MPKKKPIPKLVAPHPFKVCDTLDPTIYNRSILYPMTYPYKVLDIATDPHYLSGYGVKVMTIQGERWVCVGWFHY